ncbi:MAG: SusC/RagA family TonB-linked outer membrane protein [Gemmatimonadota bacterium]
MSTTSLGRLLSGMAAVLALSAGTLAAQATQASINVRVTDAAGNAAVDQAQVQIVGTTLGALTNAQGTAVIRNVPAGTHTVRVLRVGYAEQKKPVTVTAGQVASVEFALGQVAVSLTPVVTTATGEARREEIGNSIANINAAQLTEVAPIRNVEDLLTSRTAGLNVTSGTQTGSGARVRIRGTNSLSLSNDPIYVIDGIRMQSNTGSSNLFTGGAQPSRVGDINPEEIENIEIVKGPSAATLYGTDAANGVIVITTKKGRAGQARWNVWVEGGLLRDLNEYPTNYTIFGKQAGQTTTAALNFCNNVRVSAGVCTLDSVASFNVFEESDLTPLGTGNRQQGGASLSGGTEVVRYFVSGEHEREIGVLELPEFERERFKRDNLTLHDYTERPNALGKTSARANLNVTVSPELDMAATTNFIRIKQRFSLESNATAGLGSQIFGGPGFRTTTDILGPGTNTPLSGYRAWTPGFTWQEKAGQSLNRFIGGLNANWRPTSWMQNRLTVGNDFTDRIDDNFLFNGEGPPITATYRNGFRQDTRTDMQNFSTDLGSSATWSPSATWNFKTTAGVQYVYSLFFQSIATGNELPPGAQTPNGARTRLASQNTTDSRTLGFFVEEAVGINDRLFLTAAVRSDQNSAFGTEFQSVLYPKASVSWIMSEEGFFPQWGFMDQFRVRLAYGSSGVQPGTNDATRFFTSSLSNIQTADQPGLQISALGNKGLQPEKSTEFEGGFETRLFGSRLTIDVTGYYKKTEDALISAIVPPSVGSAARVRQNLGSVENKGLEALISAQAIDRRSVGLDFTFSASTNSNKLISLGGTEPQIGTTTRQVEGYPLFGLWAPAIRGWEDKNGDGILTYSANAALNEVFIDDTASFRGYNQPRHLATLTTGLDLFNRRLRVQSLVDYRGGNKWYNNTERIRCVSRQNCNGLMNPDASFEEQAMVVGTRDHPTRTLDGFFQDGALLRFRELSVQYNLGERWARSLFRGRSANVVASGRNLFNWTRYRGVDPEVDFTGATGDSPSEFQTLGPPSYFTIRFNIGY